MRLEVLDYTGPTRWNWRLSSAAGEVLADHEVDLDPNCWQYEAFLDLQTYLASYTAPDRREAQANELLARLGDWVAESAMGPVATELARRDGVVRVEIPGADAVVGYLPWELARVKGRTLASQLTFVIDHQPRSERAKQPIGERLRMLAVFSLPEGVGALNLRRERFALARLVDRISAANDKAIELQVLQYGVTRQRLADALLENDGWDVVHLSGHGLPAGVLLETSSGRRDRVTSSELVQLLVPAGRRIKLVTLSACSSAAVAAERQLSRLGFELPISPFEPEADSLPAVATAVAAHLDCAVVAMRYKVIDDFAIALAGEFYDLVLGKGQPVARALSLTLKRIEAVTPLSPITPTVFGARAVDLVLLPPRGGPLVFQPEREKLVRFPPQPDRFVGRVGPMTRASEALAPDSGKSGVLFHGMAGGGKTACALEIAYTHLESFPSVAWYAVPAEISDALKGFALSLEFQLPGLQLLNALRDVNSLRAFLPKLTEVMKQRRALIVLDNIETLLTDDGRWHDERWSLVVDAMLGHRGLSRLVITSRVRPVLPDNVAVEAVHALSLREAVLLAREWPHLRSLLDTDLPLGHRVLSIVQGHPKLIELANGQAKDRGALAKRLDETDRVWRERGAQLAPFLRGEEPEVADVDYVAALADWTRAVVRSLPEQARSVYLTLCCVEEGDRRPEVLSDAASDEVNLLVQRGLVEHAGDRYLVHPGVAEIGRAMATPDFARDVDEQLAILLSDSLNKMAEAARPDPGRIAAAAVRAAPYLYRLGWWKSLASTCEEVLVGEGEYVSLVLPFLEAAVNGTAGTESELTTRVVHARALTMVDPRRGSALCVELLSGAVKTSNYALAVALATSLIPYLRGQGRLDEALRLARQSSEHMRSAGYGPWSQAAGEQIELEILFEQGHHQVALDGVRRVLAGLPATSEDREVVAHWQAREFLLQLGRSAAKRLGLLDVAMAYAEQLRRSKEMRGTSVLELAIDQDNLARELFMARSVDEARRLFLWCRAVYERNGDLSRLSRTLGALAEVELHAGRHSVAVDLRADALRLAYQEDHLATISIAHHDFAVALLRSADDPDRAWAHYVAAALINFGFGLGMQQTSLEALGVHVFAQGLSDVQSFAEICALAEETDGVRLRELLRDLAIDDEDVTALIAGAMQLANDLLQQSHFLIAAVAAVATSDPAATPQVEQQLETALAQLELDSRPLAVALRRVLAGERGPELLSGLLAVARGTVRIVLDALANEPGRGGS